MAALAPVLSVDGWKMNTALVERLHLDIRQGVAVIGRRVNTLGQSEDGVQHHRAWLHAYHNWGLPHTSWRQPGRVSKATKGHGAAQRWWPWTLALAASVPDHGWPRQAVLLLRVPPWPQPQAVSRVGGGEERAAR
jgi:hypothetical protein